MREHPIYVKPTAQMVVNLAHKRGIGAKEAARLLLDARAAAMENERKNPLLFGWEPPIWRVCDALLGLDWLIPERFGKDYGPRMRQALGFEKPVRVLLINGGNRAGKSEYMTKRAVLCLLKYPQTMLWGFHTDSDMSVRYQQPLVWKYLPPEYRAKPIKSSTTYIAYNLKNGFSEHSMILPNLSTMEFRNYRQERDKIEGGELGSPELERTLGYVADELIPEDWVETLTMRLATRAACGVVGFTPVNGYTSTVKSFQDGATVARWSPAWMMPMDGGAAETRRGLQVEECDRWIDAGGGIRVAGCGEAPSKVEVEGRIFEAAPRVLRCEDPNKAVVFFHSSDNPYGNPSEVWTLVQAGAAAYRRERWYGIANKMVSGAFPLFSERVHVCREADVPKDGTNYLIVDPCSGRNMFMLWIRVTPDGRAWVYREWPNQVDAIPGVGVMGKWAEPSGDDKRLDGRIGPGARSLGWGLAQYKAMIAWFEGWGEKIADSKSEISNAVGDEVFGWPVDRIVALDQWGRHRERVFERFMDARFANVKGFDADGMETLLDEFDRVGLTFQSNRTDARESIADGVALMNNALFYDENREVDFTNAPRLMVSERCRNLIFALRTWTGLDGQKGATKDPVDCLRMFYLMGLDYVEAKAQWAAGGGGAGCY